MLRQDWRSQAHHLTIDKASIRPYGPFSVDDGVMLLAAYDSRAENQVTTDSPAVQALGVVSRARASIKLLHFKTCRQTNGDYLPVKIPRAS